MSLKLAIFDMDGLMIDSESVSFEIWKKMLLRYGEKKELTLARYCDYIGQTDEAISDMVRGDYPDIDEHELMFDVRREITKANLAGAIHAKPGLFELFAALERLGVKKSAASSTGKVYAEAELDSVGALKHLDGGIYGDMVTHSKPHPEIFLRCAEMFGMTPCECVVFEDSNAGIQCALNADIPVIAVRDLKEPREDLKEKCLAVLNNLAEAIPYVERLAEEK